MAGKMLLEPLTLTLRAVNPGINSLMADGGQPVLAVFEKPGYWLRCPRKRTQMIHSKRPQRLFTLQTTAFLLAFESQNLGCIWKIILSIGRLIPPQLTANG
jgi:hypothetical protein